MTNCGEAIERICKRVLWRSWHASHARYVLVLRGAFDACLGVEKSYLMHLREICSIHRSNRLHATDVKKKNLLISANTDGKSAILCHFNAVNISAMSLKVGEVLTCLTVPNFYLFVDLSAGKENCIVDRVKAHCSYDCLMTLQGHF